MFVLVGKKGFRPLVFEFCQSSAGAESLTPKTQDLHSEVVNMHGTYKDLKVWRRAMDLVLEVYRCTSSFPKQEIYSLTSQMRRAGSFGPKQYRRG
jgi:hypothetical protein